MKWLEWSHQDNGQECEQALGDGEGQGSLERCSPGGSKESDKPEELKNNTNEEVPTLVLVSYADIQDENNWNCRGQAVSA